MPWRSPSRPTGTIHARDRTATTTGTASPAPSMVNWFPDLHHRHLHRSGPGRLDRHRQQPSTSSSAASSRRSTAAQQGLVRFAVTPIAPDKRGPTAHRRPVHADPRPPSAGTGAGRAGRPNYDQDDLNLTYQVFRDGNTATPVFTTTADSTFWNRPTSASSTPDRRPPAAPTSTGSYANDPHGNSVAGDTAVDHRDGRRRRRQRLRRTVSTPTARRPTGGSANRPAPSARRLRPASTTADVGAASPAAPPARSSATPTRRPPSTAPTTAWRPRRSSRAPRRTRFTHRGLDQDHHHHRRQDPRLRQLPARATPPATTGTSTWTTPAASSSASTPARRRTVTTTERATTTASGTRSSARSARPA